MSQPPLRKEIIIRQISKDLFLREDIVNEVLDRFIDIAVEEIVNKGEFKFHRLLSIAMVNYKGYQAGKGVVPEHKRLRIRLSSGIHKLFKLRYSKYNGATDVITRDNWEEYLTNIQGKKHVSRDHARAVESDDLYNPLLDED